MITDETEVESWLREFIRTYDGVAGSVHVRQGKGVALAAAVNLPPKVREVTAFVPRGKGMAGLALERGVAVQSCNIQTDDSGDVRPGARAVNAKAAVALPVRDENGDVVAIVGIAFAEERAEFLGGAELQWMENHARALLDRVQDIPQRRWTER
ncbi:GAF domain-containing protein [Streptomyces ossamyceticus]|uniref:GAF domain-containing protein n=1 Tax=Streptomyces ossamyceticus TaxID=249581 RepID=UPI0006E26DF0|nr:GAF domain-containing protein [Streptomyces ossamyceticus]